MIKNIDWKNQIMKENYREYCRNSEDGEGDVMSFQEYVEREFDNDPCFLSWMYDEVLGGEFPDSETISEDLHELINY